MKLQLENAGFQISFLIFCVILFFYFYYYFSQSRFLKNYVKKHSQRFRPELYLFFIRKVSGLIFLGIIPGVLYYYFVDSSFEKFGLSINKLNASLPLIAILVSVILFILFFNQKVNKRRSTLQIDIKDWSGSLFLFNATGWIFYLIGYEFLFRGILLFECSNSFGFWPAIAVNVVIYSAIHMVNGIEQTIGALVFGIIACYFTLTHETILIPIFMHISLSVFSDYFSIKFSDKLSFVKPDKISLLQK